MIEAASSLDPLASFVDVGSEDMHVSGGRQQAGSVRCSYVAAARAAGLAARTRCAFGRDGLRVLIVDESNGKCRYFLKVRNTDKKKDGHV